MESVLVSLVVTFLFLIAAGTVGHRLGKKPRPYGYMMPIVHIALFLFVLAGVIAAIYKLLLLPDRGGLHTQIVLQLALLALLANLAVGVWMLLIKGKSRNLRAVHKISTYVMAGSIVVGMGFVAAAI
jgi:hypothetical protein